LLVRHGVRRGERFRDGRRFPRTQSFLSKLAPTLFSCRQGKKKGIANLFFLTLLELDEILVGDCDTDVWGWGKKGENCSATLCLNSWSMALVVSQSDEKYKMMENQ
jgi:hypothetical protein